MRTNPITRRVGALSNQWLDVALDRRARVLCWLIRSEEARMLDAFLALELDARTAEHEDLFVCLNSPFDAGATHGERLRDELIASYLREQQPLSAEGIDADWQPPAAERAEPGLAWFVRTCASFAAYCALPRHLVLVLRPAHVAAFDRYEAWLLELARTAPTNLRAIAVDSDGSLAFQELSEPDAPRIRKLAAELDMPGAFAEISQDAGGLDTPGGKFREAFLQLTAAVSARDFPVAERVGETALGIATREKWFHLCVPIHVLLGSAHAGEKHLDATRAHHRAAETAALRGQVEGPPEMQSACKTLRLQSRVTLGASLIACEAFEEAAEVFEQTAPLAAESCEHRTLLDCYRLASFCHERAGAPDRALLRGLEGLHAAKQIPPDVLPTTSLPDLGAALVRLCEAEQRDEQQHMVEREVDALLGSSTWHPGPAESALGAV